MSNWRWTITNENEYTDDSFGSNDVEGQEKEQIETWTKFIWIPNAGLNRFDENLWTKVRGYLYLKHYVDFAFIEIDSEITLTEIMSWISQKEDFAFRRLNWKNISWK